MVNSYIKGEDLESEMTVVRNEFERGENNPFRILMQRMFSGAYEWHNYGRTTIGNRSDIERVPIDRLKAFYRKFYRPDNIMVVVAGRFDVDDTLKKLEHYFGQLRAPETPLDKTYTTEPAQDGERTVVLRRVGTTQLVSVGYHIPSGPTPEYAALHMLYYIFGTEPSGRLHKSLVETHLAEQSYSSSIPLHDPGLIMFGAQLNKDASIESARQTLIETVENVADAPITDEEVKRAKSEFLKQRELHATEPTGIAIELSEWAAQGDWRLYFLFRDNMEKLTAQDCTAAAAKYLTRNNRTVGLFIPSEKSERVEMPTRPDLQELLADYKGRGEVEQGEQLSPDPNVIESRTTRGQLSNGLRTAWLPKKTRGKKVNIVINLRYGTEEEIQPLLTATQFMPQLLLHGTSKRSRQELKDRFDELTATVSADSSPGLLSVSIETKRESLTEVLPLVGEMLREPAFPPEEFELLRRQQIGGTEAMLTNPQALAQIKVERTLAPFDKDNVRYVPTLSERIDRFKALSNDQIKQLHSRLVNGTHGEIVAVGDFDPAQLTQMCEKAFSDWESDVAYKRIAREAQSQVDGYFEEVNTPDKENAVCIGQIQFPMRDNDADFPALKLGVRILGGGAISSRLGKRIRDDEGLSYTVAAQLRIHPIDSRAQLYFFAISNPSKMEKTIRLIREVTLNLLAEGISAEELEQAKTGFLQDEQLARSSERRIAGLIAQSMFAERDLSYIAGVEETVNGLTIDDVNKALRKYVDLKRLVMVSAGDFEKARSE